MTDQQKSNCLARRDKAEEEVQIANTAIAKLLA
jgi:hypothetical protein